MSYLTEEAQKTVYRVIDAMGVKLKPKMAEELRKHGGELTEGIVERLLEAMIVKRSSVNVGMCVILSVDIRQKYFSDMNEAQMVEVVEQALEAWFSGKEVAYVQ